MMPKKYDMQAGLEVVFSIIFNIKYEEIIINICNFKMY